MVDAADCRTERARGLRRVPLENVLEVFWRQVILRLKAAARQQRVRQAHDGGIAELDAYRELIVPLQKRSVNDAEYIPAVVQPVFVRELRRHDFKLLRKAYTRLNAETRLKRGCDSISIFTVHLPWLKQARVFPRAGVRHVKNIAQPRRIAAVVHECNALGSAPNIAPHALCPHVVPGTSRGVWALRMDE